MNVKRIIRLLHILQMLQSGEGQNVDGMAEACGVSRRTAFRDIESLRQAGVPVAFDRANDRYSIRTAFFLPPTNFTPDEALALISLTHELGRGDTLPFYEAARRAALKLESSLPAEIREHVGRLVASVRVKRLQANRLEGKQEFYELFVEAQAARRLVRVRYNSLYEQEEIETALRPYQVVFETRSWYVIGRSSLHKSVRTFNVGRVLEAEVLPETFAAPRGFSLEKHLRNAWRIIPEEGPDSEVHIRFKPHVATNVDEVRWHKTQRTKRRQDGSLDFYVTVSGLREISWWVLGYGDQAEVIKPAKLRRLLAGRAANIAEMYRPNGPD